MLPRPAFAAEILIESKVGFQGVFRLGQPFPLEVSISNVGQPVDGVLEVAVWKRGATHGGAYQALHRREVFLPARGTRTVGFTVDPEILSRPLEIRFSSAKVSATSSLDLRSRFSPAPLVLSVGGSAALPLTSFAASFSKRVVAMGAATLPPDARALAGVSHLVLYDQSLRELSRPQLAALDEWLAAGGAMVIVGSLNFALYQEPHLARFLPARVTGVRRMPFVARGADGDDRVIEGAWAQTITDVTGDVLTAAEGVPVLLQTARGKGRVVYLALDAGRPPLSNWVGLPRFLQALLVPPAEVAVASRPDWSEALASRVLLSSWFLASYIPTRGLLFAILLYLGGLAVLLRLWRRRRLAHRAIALGCLGWALCAGVLGYLVFGGGRTPQGVLFAATVMDDAGGGHVHAQTNLALFSTQRREYSLGFGTNWLDLAPLVPPGDERQGQPVVYEHSGTRTRVQLPLDGWGVRLLRARHVERVGISASIELREGTLRVEVRNRSDRDLTDCWLLAPGLRVALGAVPRGTGLLRSYALNARPREGSVVESSAEAADAQLPTVTFDNEVRGILFHEAFAPKDSTHVPWYGGTALFTGWIEDPQSRAEVDDERVRLEQYTLYRAIVRLPIEEED